MKLAFTVFLAFLCLLPAACRAENTDITRQVTIVSRDGKSHVFHIELALTPQQQEKGLMNRTEMAKDAGMLFYFGKEGERSFWMKDTLIPLDMLFLKADGKIAHIHDSAIPNDLTSVKSNGPAMAVLELNGGAAKELGIVEGDRVKHPFFGSVQ
jgi:uncharacterized protein